MHEKNSAKNNDSDIDNKTTSIDKLETNSEEKLPFWHIVLSVLAAAIGVQRKDNLKKDFNAKNSIYIYIASGILFTALFVLTVALVVKTVLSNIT